MPVTEKKPRFSWFSPPSSMAPRIAAPARAHHRCVVGGDLAVFSILFGISWFTLLYIFFNTGDLQSFFVLSGISWFILRFLFFYTGISSLYATRRTEKKTQVEEVPEICICNNEASPEQKKKHGLSQSYRVNSKKPQGRTLWFFAVYAIWLAEPVFFFVRAMLHYYRYIFLVLLQRVVFFLSAS